MRLKASPEPEKTIAGHPEKETLLWSQTYQIASVKEKDMKPITMDAREIEAICGMIPV